MAPQGFGAMVSMPIGGKLVDKIGPKFVVIPGISLIVLGLGAFSQAGLDTSLWYTSGALFVMGLGMGCTMMPLMTSALATLTDHKIARGSTLMNIVQQTGASIGAAVVSVILTSQMTSHGIDAARMESQQAPSGDLPPAMAAKVHELLVAAGDAFSNTFVVSVVIIACTLVPALFLPRSKVAPKRQAAADGSAGDGGAAGDGALVDRAAVDLGPVDLAPNDVAAEAMTASDAGGRPGGDQSAADRTTG